MTPGDTVWWADAAAPLVFLACWIGYARWADRGRGYPGSLMARTDELRGAWMRQMLAREVRIVDIQVVQVLVNAIAFFASSAVLVIGGAIAVLGAREQAMEVIASVPFAAQSPPRVWEAKVLLLVVVFVYAFFKFTWALRQFNYVAIFIGATPPHTEAADAAAGRFAAQAARAASRASDHFNKAMRSYYFGLAALGWFVHPYLLVALTVAVVLVVYRREFRSRTLTDIAAALGHAGAGGAGGQAP
jgi:uncharacterized membrane protein